MTGWLLGTLFATSGLALLVLPARGVVRRRFGSRVTYGLWLIPAARIFMPTLTHTVERPVPEATNFNIPAPQALTSAHLAVRGPSLLDAVVNGLPGVIVAIWLSVAAALFLSRVIAFHRDRDTILASSVSSKRLGLIRIIRASATASPIALGIFRPIIAVPADFERRYSKRERRLVLDHELAHHRSGDLIANLFAFVLLCLQWFNPLAWIAHAAFRFDQEAACDARVLDKAPAADRASYGRAIAKTASGRALLFASALDRPTSLQRRLQSMLSTPTSTRRAAGRLLIVTAIALALPLTASRAIAYVDVPETVPALAPLRAASATIPATSASMSAALPEQRAIAPVPGRAPVAAPAAASYAPGDGDHVTLGTDPGDADHVTNVTADLVTINGQTKRWEELTPAEKASVRRAVDKARAALANTHFDQAKIMRDLAQIQDRVHIDQIQRELALSKESVESAMRGVDENAPFLKSFGRDPEETKAEIREAMKSVQAIDPETIRRALGAVDQQKIAAALAGAQESVQRAKMQLDRIQQRIDSDQRH